MPLARFAAASVLALAALLPSGAQAGCGCDKPPPPRAAVRPFVAWVDASVTLFDSKLQDGAKYRVRFDNVIDGTSDWSRSRARTRRDFADRQYRVQLKVKVPTVGLGPVAITVYRDNDTSPLFVLGDDKFTVAADPIVLHDFAATTSRAGYNAAVGRDGTIYVPVDVSEVSGATRFTGAALGFPLEFQADNIAMYNDQGFLMQLLDPSIPGLFDLYGGDQSTSSVLSYWRHEFRTYKKQHRQADAFNTDDDPDWHADGSPHIDHDFIVVAIRGHRTDGANIDPGVTPPFKLAIISTKEER
jgi:hypothetical protein